MHRGSRKHQFHANTGMCIFKVNTNTDKELLRWAEAEWINTGLGKTGPEKDHENKHDENNRISSARLLEVINE